MRGRPPKDDDRKVTGHALQHDWIDVPNVPYSGFVPNLPPGLPEATKEWWRITSRMPHAALWDDSDWEFALNTALIHAAFQSGEFKYAPELRRWMDRLGTTMDARRMLRIRYIDPELNSPVELQGDRPVDIAVERKRRLAS